MSMKKFLYDYWEKKAVHIACDRSSRKFQSLFSWEKLNNLLDYSIFSHDDLELVLDGKVLTGRGIKGSGNLIMPHNLIRVLQRGATLKINAVHRRLAEVSDLVNSLRTEIRQDRINVNAYCSWPGHKAYIPHFDCHEVFILQIVGKKQWFVLEEPVQYPLQQDSYSFNPPDLSKTYINCVVQPGDVLYIPKGHWHHAMTIDEPSIHLTLGINCYTGIDFVEWLVETLHTNPEFRKNLPLNFTSSIETKSFNDHISFLLEQLKRQPPAKEVANFYYQHLLENSPERSGFSLPYRAGFEVSKYDRQTKFLRNSSQKIELIRDSSQENTHILINGKKITFRGLQVSDELVQSLTTKSHFSGIDFENWFPALNWEDQICPIIRMLVMEGVISVYRDND